MAKINPELAENIHRNLTAHIRESYISYYQLAYSFVKNQEVATDIVTNAVYFSLYNGRKLKNLPPMQVWFLQLVVKDGMRNMHRNNFQREFTTDSQLYAYMETLEPSAVNAFKLYYFEKLNMEKVCAVLHFNEQEILKRLAYARQGLNIDSSLDEESVQRLEELHTIYRSPMLPSNLEEKVEASIRREEEEFANFLVKQRQNKVKKPLGVLALALGIFVLTVIAGRTNPIFAESVLNVPFINQLFAPFF